MSIRRQRILGLAVIVFAGYSFLVAPTFCAAQTKQTKGRVKLSADDFTGSEPAKNNRYNLGQFKIKIVPPGGWKCVGPTDQDKDTSSMVFHPVGDTDFTTNLALATMPLASWPIKFKGEKKLEEILAYIKENQTSDVIISEEKITFAGKPAIQILTESTPQSERKVKAKVIIFILNDKSILISCTAPKDLFESMLPTFEGCLKSFSLKQEARSRSSTKL